MLNNYQIDFKIKELLGAFFGRVRKNLDFFNGLNNFVYELGSGRQAIYLCLKDIERKIGLGEIICPNYSCKSIPRAIIKAGFTPVFVDMDNNLSLDFKKIEDAISKNTKAIIFYHPWGFLHNKKIIDIAKKNNVLIIEDCAQILNNKHKVGRLGDYSFFSFRTSKLIGVGSGAVLLSREKISIPIQKSSKFIQIIDLKDLIFRSKIINYPKLRAGLEKLEGFKPKRMGKFNKNLLINELKFIESKIAKRINNYERIKKAVEQTRNFKNINFEKQQIISPVYFPVLCKDKKQVMELFKKNKINATGYYDFINSDCFEGREVGRQNSDKFAQNLINIPLHDKLTDNQIDYIVKIIRIIDAKIKE